jgi:uncharacterized protein YceK
MKKELFMKRILSRLPRANLYSIAQTTFCVVLMVALLSGCSSFNKRAQSDPMEFIELYALADPDHSSKNLTKQLSKTTTLNNSQSVVVRTIPLLSSSEIRNIQVVPMANNKNALVLHLDSHGKMRWMQICAEMPGEPVVFATDGTFRFYWRIPRRSAHESSDTIVIQTPLSDSEALAIAKQAKRNFRLTH